MAMVVHDNDYDKFGFEFDAIEEITLFIKLLNETIDSLKIE